MNTQEALAVITKLVEDRAEEETVTTTYSGRGMMGRTCVGIVTPFRDEVLMDAGTVHLPRPSIDQLGRGYVVYWPEFRTDTSPTPSP